MANQSAGGRRNPTRPPRLPSIPVFPKGPKLYDYSTQPKIGGHGQPPPGFITPSNSIIEWQVYHALAKIFGQPKDPRKPPYIGSHGLWEYQTPYGDYGTPGSTTIDFVVYPSAVSRGVAYALRVVTELHHLFQDPRKRAKDQIQEAALSKKYIVRDVYEQHVIYDDTNQTCIKYLKHILAGGTAPDPFSGGNAQRIRDRDPLR